MTPLLPGLSAAAGPLVIAEAGVNHNGSLDLAIRLVDAAAEAGADVVKFQTFSPELLTATEAKRAPYQYRDGESESQFDLIRSLALSQDDFAAIASHCAEKRIVFLSTPFDRPSADFLLQLGIPAIKVSSGDLTSLPFLKYLAGRGRPLIVSTGMATMDEVDRAVATVEGAGCRDYALLHCTSNYPTAPADVNLLAMRALADRFECPVGYSDHTAGIDISIAAAALGARIVEKHFTLDRSLPGPDHQASLEPVEFRQMTESLRRVAVALGDGIKQPAESERAVAEVARRSLAAARALPAGAVIGETDLVELRPGTGIPPSEAASLIGRRVRKPVAAYSILDWAMLE